MFINYKMYVNYKLTLKLYNNRVILIFGNLSEYSDLTEIESLLANGIL